MQDVLRGWSRRGGESPELVGVVREIADICHTYNVRQTIGDRYAAGWVRQSFRAERITYVESKLTKAEAYIESLALFSEGRIQILDHPQLIRELQCLERRTRTGGKDIVDHPRGGHDDFSNVLCLAAAEEAAWKKRPRAGIATA